MFRYILKRIIILIPTLLATSLLIFWAMDLAGGDPVDQILPENATFEQKAALREEMGIDRESVILLISTEGDTDPAGYRRVVNG